MGGNEVLKIILDYLIQLSPFLFVVMSIYILLKLRNINGYVKIWEITSLEIIPVSFMLLYVWVGFGNPSIEIARIGLRICVGIMLAVACHVLHSINKRLANGGK